MEILCYPGKNQNQVSLSYTNFIVQNLYFALCTGGSGHYVFSAWGLQGSENIAFGLLLVVLSFSGPSVPCYKLLKLVTKCN